MASGPAADLYRANQRRYLAMLVAVRSEWARLGVGGWDEGWLTIGPRIVALVSAAQLGAARDGAEAVLAAADDLGLAAAAEVAPGSLAGWASDGRPLDSLLSLSVARARESGLGAAEALRVGGSWLDMVAQTQVADAARDAGAAQIISVPKLGYVRFVNPPCCQRCAVLAGKYFRWNAGFRRHPRCDCQHRAVKRGERLSQDIGPGDVRDLTIAQRWAIDNGADMTAVINAHRANQRSADMMTTFEGTGQLGGQRPWAVQVRNEVRRQQELLRNDRVGAARPGVRTATPVAVRERHTIPARPTPAAIQQMAGSREEAVRLLALNGYLVGDLSEVALKALGR
ncbi:MAG: hypothetical protein KBF43_05415 [Dermatophilaceae bacterium]|nr:hypothetical protein [Dermatophilaceae bacterium]